jgi:hypothetical protein
MTGDAASGKMLREGDHEGEDRHAETRTIRRSSNDGLGEKKGKL